MQLTNNRSRESDVVSSYRKTSECNAARSYPQAALTMFQSNNGSVIISKLCCTIDCLDRVFAEPSYIYTA